MKNSITKILAVVLCVMLCMNIAVPAFAEGENNTAGVEFSLALDKNKLYVSDADQTVTLSINASSDVTILDMEYVISCDDSFAVGTPTSPAGLSDWNANIKKMGWIGMSAVTTDVLGTVDVTIPANTPAGSYEFKVEGIKLSNGAVLGEYFESAAYASATLTIENAPTAPYIVEAVPTVSSAVVDDTVTVNVKVDGAAGSFNSALVKLSYDPACLTFVSGAAAQTMGAGDQPAEITAANGEITIIDFGTAFVNGNAYTLTFTAAAGTEGTKVEVVGAGFSTADEAAEENLTPAETLDAEAIAIGHKVSVNGTQVGSVAHKGTYTLDLSADYDPNCDYTVTATIDGVTAVVVDNKNGTWDIAGVTGTLAINYTEVGKVFNVRWADNDNVVTNKVDKVTYGGTDITFTVPARQDPVDVTDGYMYVASAALTADSSVAVPVTLASDGVTYTIESTDVTGDITITVEKVTLDADTVTITVSGKDVAVEGASGNVVVVPAGDEVTLVLTPEPGYTYSVTVGESTTPVTFTNNEYTFTANASVTVTVNKTVDTGSLAVQEYLTLDEDAENYKGNVYLVTIGTKINSKVYTYNGSNMFWSDKYDAYCYLVFSETEPAVDDIKDYIGLTGGTAVTVDYSGDVNKSSKKDVNDAQLVWNMYNALYSDFNTVSMEKFLRADMNTTVGVNVTDAQAVIAIVNP